jgi:Homeodomain-like domain
VCQVAQARWGRRTIAVVRNREEVEEVLELVRAGLSQSAIARLTGIPRTTIRDWLAGRTPAVRDGGVPSVPRGPYAYLLGLYLGDGFIASAPRTTCLRIYLDARYPGIIGECVRAIRAVRPNNRVSVKRRVPTECVVVECSSKAWPSVFPQHGPGPKHERSIELADWQLDITHEHPQKLIRGLLHSDGCRFMNTVRHGTRRYGYSRYHFTNRSEDIKAILCEHLDLLGIAWRRASDRNISIARREAVAALDAFVGPKS